jgi:hypothetical protein
VTFSQATSDVPTLEAWDDFTLSTTTNEIFAGTTGNGNIPMISGVATTDGAPSSNWKPSGVTGGGATINRILGSTNYVNLSASSIGASGAVRFNLVWEIPYDATVPADCDCVFVIRYSYSGSAPVLTWEFNDEDAGGTESVPVWSAITPGSSGDWLVPGDSGCVYTNVVIHKPPTGTTDNAELWLLAA